MKIVDIHRKVNQSFAPLWTEDYWRYAILMGGRGGGRSTALSQYGESRLTDTTQYCRGAFMRAVGNDIRSSIYREICDRLDDYGIRDAEGMKITDNDMVFEYAWIDEETEKHVNTLRAHGFRASSGSLTARLKSFASYNVILIEEAEEIGKLEFRTLDDSLRTLRGDIKIVLALNPPAKSHWIIREWFDLEESDITGFYIPHLKESRKDDTIFINCNYLDNVQNLDDRTIKNYRTYEITDPPYYYNKILGLVPEDVRGKIYHGWNRVPSLPKGATLMGIGVDWGWFPDPCAAHALYYLSGEYYVDEIIIANEIDDEALAGFIKRVPGFERVPTICGVDEPKAIDGLKKYGIKKACGGVSGKGSVEFRIKAVTKKRMNVVVDPKWDSTIDEEQDDKFHGAKTWRSYENYAWDEYKDGKPKGVPKHDFSDPMDSIGYAVGYFDDPGKTNSGVKVNTPDFVSYGHKGDSPKSPGKRVSVNLPGR